jgi:hypothetical protein
MADHKDPERVDTGRPGGLTSWTNADARGERHQRMEAVRQKSPASDIRWAEDLGFGTDPSAWTPQQDGRSRNFAWERHAFRIANHQEGHHDQASKARQQSCMAAPPHGSLVPAGQSL